MKARILWEKGNRMDDFSVVNSELKVRVQSECILTPLGVLFEKDTLADCMADETIRPFFGRVLQRELMPLLPKDGRDEAVIAACRFLSQKAVPPACDEMLEGLIGRFSLHIIPALTADTPGLVKALAALVMLFSGIRRQTNGFELVGAKGDLLTLREDGEALCSFSRLSCDMAPESLAYAVLSDAELWGRDLREEDRLTDALTAALRDIQLTGLSETLKAFA